MADWIASNEKYFPLIPIDENEVFDKKQRLINGWRKWFKEFYLWNPKYEFTPEIYSDRFGFEPNDLQNKIMELIDNILNPGIIILEAPMGERVIIVMGAVCVIKSRVSGTLTKYISCIA